MKKKFILASLMFVFGMCIMPNVYADELPQKCSTDVKDLDSFNTALADSQCTTIQLNGNITTTAYIGITKSLTLDLNGHTISRSDGTVLYAHESSANLTIKDSAGNGSINSGGTSTVFADNGATLTIDSNAKINNTGNTKDSVAVVSNVSTTLTINNGATITATNIAVQAGLAGQ